MLRRGYERRSVPDVVVGTSVGAINGALIASRPQTVETAYELVEIWRGRPARAGLSASSAQRLADRRARRAANTTRGALYKTLLDAGHKLRAALSARGLGIDGDQER